MRRAGTIDAPSALATGRIATRNGCVLAIRSGHPVDLDRDAAGAGRDRVIEHGAQRGVHGGRVAFDRGAEGPDVGHQTGGADGFETGITWGPGAPSTNGSIVNSAAHCGHEIDHTK